MRDSGSLPRRRVIQHGSASSRVCIPPFAFLLHPTPKIQYNTIRLPALAELQKLIEFALDGLGVVQHPLLGPEAVSLAFVHQLHCLVRLLFSLPPSHPIYMNGRPTIPS